MTSPACMGGACPRRESCCRYYHAAPSATPPAERLCEPGQTDAWMPIHNPKTNETAP